MQVKVFLYLPILIERVLLSSLFSTDAIVFTAGLCIKDTKSAVNGGMFSKKLVYKDQVVELTYEGGDVCAANPALKHKSIISFICKSDEVGGSSKPVLVDSDKDTCTHFFSWHTSLVCEQQVLKLYLYISEDKHRLM